MGSTPKAIIVLRVAKTLLLLCEQPLTAKELGEKLGITQFCAYLYLEMMKEAGYEIRSRVRVMPGAGMNPTEYSLIGLPEIIKEAFELMRVLKGM